jgi:hypothetical protein
MPPATPVFLALALSACAAGGATQGTQTPQAQGATSAKATGRADAMEHSVGRAASRLGPPSVRGLSLRRVDRPSRAQPPIAWY